MPCTRVPVARVAALADLLFTHHSTCLQALLSRPDCTLEALLQEDELLQELKALNNRVIDLCVTTARSAGARNAGLGPAPDRNARPQRPQRLRHRCLPASPRLVTTRVVT